MHFALSMRNALSTHSSSPARRGDSFDRACWRVLPLCYREEGRMISGKAVSAAAAVVFIGSAVAGENKANDYLLALPPAQRAQKLGGIAGEGCAGAQSFYRGAAE